MGLHFRRTSVAIASRRSSASTSSPQQDRKLSSTPASARRAEKFIFGKAKIIGTGAALLIIAAIGIGLGVGLSRRGGGSDNNVGGGLFWRPSNGTTWQIEILSALDDTSTDAEVYDIDLYSNSPTTITDLHNLGRKVICYFSAGTYETFRPDHMLFQPSDYANPVQDWPGEWWLDTRSENVRSIMVARLNMAADKGCDGVDPDNTDGYQISTGFPLSEDTALDYLQFLAREAHARNLSIGLKNTGPLVKSTLNLMQWEINEQCELYNECSLYRPFISAGKPVFHIVYPTDAPSVDAATKQFFCNSPNTEGFSTIIKNVDLDDWRELC